MHISGGQSNLCIIFKLLNRSLPVVFALEVDDRMGYRRLEISLFRINHEAHLIIPF